MSLTGHHKACGCVLCEAERNRDADRLGVFAAVKDGVLIVPNETAPSTSMLADPRPWLFTTGQDEGVDMPDNLGAAQTWRVAERMAEEREKAKQVEIHETKLADEARIRAEAIHLCVLAFEAKLNRGDLLGIVNREWRTAFGGGL